MDGKVYTESYRTCCSNVPWSAQICTRSTSKRYVWCKFQQTMSVNKGSLLHGHGPWLMCEVTLETKTCIRRGVVTSEASNWPTLMAVGIQNWRRRTKWKSGSEGTKFISLTVWTMKHPRHGRMTSLVKMMPPIAFVVRPQSFIPVKLYWVSLVISNTQVRGVLYKKKGYISYHLWIGSYLLFIPIFLFTWKLPKANFFSVKL